MRSRVAMALAAGLLVAGCGMLGAKNKPDPAGEIAKPSQFDALVTRCPVPKAYGEDTLKQVQEALDGLPPDNVLRKVMKDYESERDDLRMCQ